MRCNFFVWTEICQHQPPTRCQMRWNGCFGWSEIYQARSLYKRLFYYIIDLTLLPELHRSNETASCLKCWELKERFGSYLFAITITFFVPYKRAGTHFSIHPAKRQYTPPSKKSQKSLENQNWYNWWSKSQVKKRFMPGYTGILSPRTYLSSSLHLQLADSLFKPTSATFFSIYFNIQ